MMIMMMLMMNVFKHNDIPLTKCVLFPLRTLVRSSVWFAPCLIKTMNLVRQTQLRVLLRVVAVYSSLLSRQLCVLVSPWP